MTYKNNNYVKEYYQNNKKERLQYLKEYYQKNKKKIGLRQKEYRSCPDIKERNKKYHKEYEQKPKVRARRKEYLSCPENIEIIKKFQKQYRQKNKKNIKEYMNEYIKQRKKKDRYFSLTLRLRRLVLYSIKNYSATGKIMTSKKYGIDYKEIIQHLKPFPENIREFQIDHIIPLSMWDFNNPEQVKKAFAPKNHQWLTVNQNMWKKARLVSPRFVDSIS